MSRAATRLMTADELWNMRPDGMRHELVRGELRTMAPAGFEHGAVGMRLGAALFAYVEANDLGVVVMAETGFTIQRNPDTVRAPDIAFIRNEKIPAGGLPKKFWTGTPDLVVEVVSPSDRPSEVDDKINNWLQCGAALVWVLNSAKRTMMVYRPDCAARAILVDDMIDGEDVVPGFKLPLKKIFKL
jgi:Uma2 family endonuclease